MKQTLNFSAGPAVLPKSVLEIAQKELLNYRNTGMSVMELSHRSSIFQEILDHAKQQLSKLMNIPETHSILFLQGGASLQFHMIPLNFGRNKKMAYVDTGNWSQKAIDEARRIGEVEIIASGKEQNYQSIPQFDARDLDDFAYIHITSNNTLEGTAFQSMPETGNTPLIVDASSNILSCEIDVSKCALIYAGAQKNIGMAGVTVVIIRNDILKSDTTIPPMLSYKTMVDNDSLYNTPTTYGIYMAGLVFDWLIEQGGVSAMMRMNEEKANLLYRYIDASNFYSSPVDKDTRSLTNIPFTTPSKELDQKFLEKAENERMFNLKGHRLVGGMRASLYNAFPISGVQSLINLMKEFEEENQ